MEGIEVGIVMDVNEGHHEKQEHSMKEIEVEIVMDAHVDHLPK
jgi:hypothetical protein